MLAFLVSPFAKLIGGALLLFALGGGVKLWFVEHDAAVVAKVAAAETATRLVEMQKDNARINAALQTLSEAAQAQEINLRQAREAVANATQSTSCGQSASMRAAIGGLRSKPTGSH